MMAVLGMSPVPGKKSAEDVAGQRTVLSVWLLEDCSTEGYKVYTNHC